MLLPAPLGPTSATISPGHARKLTSSRTSPLDGPFGGSLAVSSGSSLYAKLTCRNSSSPRNEGASFASGVSETEGTRASTSAIRSTLARTFPMMVHCLMILRVGLNMFWMRRMKKTIVPTLRASRPTSHIPSQTTAEIETASSTPNTQLNPASSPTESSAAAMAL